MHRTPIVLHYSAEEPNQGCAMSRIARVLAARPAYILLDEPFADIDPIAIGHMQTLIRELAQRGFGILVADNMNHNTRKTLEVSDRAYVICSGEVLGTLTT